MVKTGLDRISANWPKALSDARIGLVCHPASVNARYQHASDVFLRFKQARLSAFFGPQHGIRGETQANMIEWEGSRDKVTGLPVYSLYGQHRKPTSSMLEGLDALVLDLFDVGARYYTYIWTLYLCMEACVESGKPLVVLDRPNPIGGEAVEGPVLDPAFASFVGLKPLAIRHGMTIGEIARYFKGEFLPAAELHIVKCVGWKRGDDYSRSGLPFVNPSPNIPNLESAYVYPGLCLLEGTNVSEGRGTTRPFELFGTPFTDPEKLVRCLDSFKLPGVRFRPAFFMPTFDKFKGEICGGAQIHVLNKKRFKPFLTGAAILKAYLDLYPSTFQWHPGPYEYEHKLKPIDILFGSDRFRILLENNVTLKVFEGSYAEERKEFMKMRKKYLIY
ncbi:MAG: DUF1343 domain-containing protein [Fibrobacterota bacterium]